MKLSQTWFVAAFLVMVTGLLSPVRVWAAAAAPAPNTEAGIELGAPFADNAVLQRQMAVPVWGWSQPGTKMTVAFAGQVKSAAAGADGKWMVHLDPLAASFEPRTMTITSGAGAQRTLKNILVGEVWLAAGQSNMELAASRTDCKNLVVKPKDGVVPIREFSITSCYAQLQPIEKAQGEWKCGDYGAYSAIALSFADVLYQELGVPIGILNCSFSETSIQAWTPRVGFQGGKDAYTQAIYQKVLESDPHTPEHQAAWDRFYQQIAETLQDNAERVKKGEQPQAIPTQPPGNLRSNRDATWLFNARLNPVIPYALRGAIWNQGYANMREGLVYYNNLHSLIRGWRLLWDRPDLPVYFHQFYTPGNGNDQPSIASTSEMRLGTWLARDIPHADMASQIDIGGAVHYFDKAVPGLRFALLALKYQYPATPLQPTHDTPAWQMPRDGKAADLVAHGPMFKSYTVEGNKLIVSFDHADGGLVVAQTAINPRGFSNPKVIPDGDAQVKLFYLADAQRVWHPAQMKIAGDQVVLTADGVSAPQGVSYATSGVAFQPNLYNQALLPTTPFIYFDHKLVTSQTWPDPELKIAGVAVNPNSVGLLYEWRKMPLLSTQFRDNAVLQAGQPITFWGSVLHDWGYAAKGKAVVEFSFAGIHQTIPVQPGPSIVTLGPGTTCLGSGMEWRVTVPAMPASAEPKTLKVRFLIDGKLAHETICTNIVIGDVWYVAAPQMKMEVPAVPPSQGMVRVMVRRAKRSAAPCPSRYSVAVSTTPDNRFACRWENATGGFAGLLGQEIHARTGQPVGIIFMQNTVAKKGANPPLKSWIAGPCLKTAPSLRNDYRQFEMKIPGTSYYDANVRQYVAAWKQYWGQYIPQMIATKGIPAGAEWGGVWGHYPMLDDSVKSTASETYNVLVDSFTPAALKGIVFLTSPDMFRQDQGALFGEQMTALANCWKGQFGGQDPHFFYTVPSRELAPKIAEPQGIQGTSTALTITQWPTGKAGKDGKPPVADLIKQIVADTYR